MVKSKSLKSLLSEYKKRKSEIKNRLREFSLIHTKKDEDIFSELSFCLLTANANALRCHEAIKDLKKNGLLFRGRPGQLKPKLKGRVRFHNKKAKFIVLARNLFKTWERSSWHLTSMPVGLCLR